MDCEHTVLDCKPLQQMTKNSVPTPLGPENKFTVGLRRPRLTRTTYIGYKAKFLCKNVLMSLTIDNTELGMFLPMRSGLSIAEYQQILAHEFAEGIVEAFPDHFCKDEEHGAIIFSADMEDDGTHVIFQGCEDRSLIFLRSGYSNIFEYNKSLLLLYIESEIIMFFADFKYIHAGRLYFDLPKVIYKRLARQNKRVSIVGKVLLGRRNGQQVEADLRDFSLAGASFVTKNSDFQVGESLFIEFDVPGCGKCETIATIVRREACNHPDRHWVVAIKMMLNKEQRKKAEYLYLCEKGTQIKSMSDVS